MIATGKCPKCGRTVSSVNIESVDIKQGFQSTFLGVSYVCPNGQCHAVLGVGLDPIALKTDTIAGVVKALRKAR